MSDYRKALLINIGAFVLAVLVLGGAIIWTGLRINEKAAEISDLRAELRSRFDGVYRLSLLRTQKEEVSDLGPYLDKILPERDRVVSLARQLEDLAKERGVKMRFSFGAERPSVAANSSLGSVEFTMTVDGTFAGILDFTKVVDSLFAVKFASFDVARKGDEYSALIGGVVFYR